jgi:hypothetical protein
MNNFVFSQDPILYGSTIPQYQADPVEIKKQLDVVMAQYQQLQQNKNDHTPQPTPTPIDYLGELDSLLSNLDESDLQALNSDIDFINLNNSVQQIVQAEIINNIKWKVNSNPITAESVSKLKTIINNVRRERESEQRRSMSELNDYIQNYSDMTFNEYKKIKSIRDESK